MKILSLRAINKTYQLSKNKSFTALKDINLSFERNGFVSIVGKSGSGKSTLLNLIARIDVPSSGEILLNKKPYSKKKRTLNKFYREDVGIVFQNFNLLENMTVMENVVLPLLIKGASKKVAYRKAEEILRYVNIGDELYNLSTSRLSGGEKQRVAIARAIITSPKIVLCDEPTGALDSMNSELVMQLLKRISKERLVIMVSHNLQLVNKYSNRIIELSDGRVINDYQKSKYEKTDNIIETKIKGRPKWINKFCSNNYRRRIKRNIFVIASLSICMIMANLVVGFINGKDKAIISACYKQLDFACGTISKEEVVSNTGMLKLTKSVRPSLDSLMSISNITENFHICPNFSAILPQNLEISFDGVMLENILYTPIYSFIDDSIDRSLVKKGYVPTYDALDEVLINKKCYQTIKSLTHTDPLNETLSLHYRVETIYVNEQEEYINDVFEFNQAIFIAGVVDELDYLSTNKIYYSYLALESFMQEYQLNNLSTYSDTKVTWYDRVVDAEDYSILSSYSYLLFLKDYRLRNTIIDNVIFSKELSFSSNSLIVTNSLVNFLEVAKYALFLFLGITTLGAVLILGVISLTNYSEDRKISAILSVLGAKEAEIQDIYLTESLISGFISLLISFALSFPLATLVNNIIQTKTSLTGVINIPFLSFFDFPFLYPIIAIGAVMLLVGIFTLIPIKFSKSSSIRTELQSND